MIWAQNNQFSVDLILTLAYFVSGVAFSIVFLPVLVKFSLPFIFPFVAILVQPFQLQRVN